MKQKEYKPTRQDKSRAEMAAIGTMIIGNSNSLNFSNQFNLLIYKQMETKNNAGAIFKNNYKKTESHPDYKGKCMVNGKEMEIALWVKDTKTGEKYFSASFSEPYVAQEPTNPPVPLNDDLPF
jgi:uncharacterized protein (DUF736 family)